ncbi:MAG: hypothetical protein JWM20_636 [Patescibacteria group bacterium]|nr:hypothetical protein [Patescibacteria group bacterium]
MRKKVFLAGGVIALFILIGTTHAYAQSSLRSFHGSAAISMVASKLNLSSDDVALMKAEIASGKSVKDVLAEHNITMDQIRSAIQAAYPQTKHLSNTQIAAISAKLGINPADVQNEINAGKSLQQIMKDHNITPDKLRAAFESEGIAHAAKKGKLPKKAKS